MASYPGTQVVPVGEYYTRIGLVNSQGVETDLSSLGAQWPANPAASGSWGMAVATDRELAVFIPDKVPTGYTANLYLSTQPGQQPSGLRLWKSGLQPGTRKVVIDTFTFEDVNKGVPSVWGWIMDWVIDNPAEVITFGETIVANAPFGLAEDEFANVTQPLVNVPVTNYSWMDSSGFSSQAIELGSNGRYFYISANGNNNNNGLTPATALKTLSKLETVAASEIAKLQGGGCIVRMRRGDTFLESGSRLGRGWGQDFQHPLIVESYWDPADGPDPGTRPIISNSILDSPFLFQTTNTSPVPGPAKFVILRGLHLKCNTSLGNYPVQAFKQYLGAEHWLLEDMISEGFALNLAVDGTNGANWGAYSRHVTYHRCIIIDSDGRGYGPAPSGVFVQGTHCDNGSEFLVSQCFMHKNGYYNAAIDLGNIFSHSNYWNFGMHYQTAWGNHILDGGSHGIHYRGGGTCSQNVIAQHGIGVEMNLFGGTLSRNIFINMRNIPNGNVLCVSSIFSLGMPVRGNALFEENFLLHAAGTTDSRGVLTSVYAALPGVGHSVKYGMFIERNNTYYQVGPAGWTENFPEPHKRFANIHVSTTAMSNQLIRLGNATTFTNWNFLQSDKNIYKSSITGYIGGVASVSTLPAWRTATGEDMNSFDQPVTFVQPTFGLDQSAQAKGWLNHADLVLGHRARGLRVWDQRYGAEGAWSAFSDAYRPTNLPSLDAGPYGYYGAKDYRGTLPVSYTLTGPAAVTRGKPTTFTLQPGALASETVALSDGGRGGSFAPGTLTWVASNAPRQFDYTAAVLGPALITVTRLVSPVATLAINVVAGMRNTGRQTSTLAGNISSGIT